MSEYSLKEELQPSRMEYAKNKIIEKGYTITFEDETQLQFEYFGNIITHFAYTGWHSGKGIKAGRGIERLLKQI